MSKSFLSQNKWKVEEEFTALKSCVKCDISSSSNKIITLFERLNQMSSNEKKTLEILKENITFLQKELTSKYEIIKIFIKVQTSTLESVSYQKTKKN